MLTNLFLRLGLTRDSAHWLWLQLVSVAALITSQVFDVQYWANYLHIPLSQTALHWILAVSTFVLWISAKNAGSSLPGRKLVIALCCVLLWPSAASAQEAPPDHARFYAGVAMTGVLDVLDLKTTRDCLRAFPVQCHESNPALKFFVDRYGTDRALIGNLIVKAGVLATLAVLHHRKPEWDRFWTASVFTMGGVQAIVDISNANTLRRLRTQ